MQLKYRLHQKHITDGSARYGKEHLALPDMQHDDQDDRDQLRDPMAAARILCKYQDGDKSKKFVVKGGFLEGKVLSAAETNAIAKLPGREGMLSMFAGALTSTLSGLAVAMQAFVDKQEEPAA